MATLEQQIERLENFLQKVQMQGDALLEREITAKIESLYEEIEAEEMRCLLTEEIEQCETAEQNFNNQGRPGYIELGGQWIDDCVH